MLNQIIHGNSDGCMLNGKSTDFRLEARMNPSTYIR